MDTVKTDILTDNGTSPVRPFQQILDENTGSKYVNRLLIGTPTTGLVRIEWAMARMNQIVPMNWSNVLMTQSLGPWTPTLVPLAYMVADAQNIIVETLIQQDMEWLMLLEHDVLLPQDAFVRFNEYIRNEDTPIVSGLYFSRSRPSDPLVFRKRGTSVYTDWQMGDKVWVDGVPTGCLLIHSGILRELWKDSEEYQVNGRTVRRVFNTPMSSWQDPETTNFWVSSGTSDLDFCTRIMDGGYLAKAGWHEYQDKEFPFLIDTGIFCQHIDASGERYP